MSLIRLDDLQKSFGATKVLRGVSLEAERSEFVTLLGPSGCGKTTTLRIIAGLTAPDAGRVWLNGADVTDLAPDKRSVNTVFQNYALFPHMNVERNIAYGLRLRRVPRAEIRRRVEEMLALVQLPGYGGRRPSELSGGQRQRVAIARALILNPDLLLLDEPLGALDQKLRQQMQTELKALQKKLGITFLYITHDQEEALNMSDRIAVMNGGRFEQVGSPEDVYERPRTRFVAGFIGQGALFDGTAVSVRDGVMTLQNGDGRMLARAGDFREGDRAAVSVHSERIRYGAKKTDGFDLPATVAAHRYAGSVLRTELALRSGRVVACHSTGALSALPPPGTPVYVSWDAGHASPVPAEENA